MNYSQRLSRLQDRLTEEGVDLFYFEHPTHILYLTGLDISTGRCLVGREKAHLLVDSRYIEICRAECPFPAVLDEKELLYSFLREEYQGIRKAAFDAANLSYEKGDSLQKNWREKISPSLEFFPAPDWILELRSIKEEEEKAALRRAARLGSEGYDFLLSQLREGVTEKELAIELDIFWKRKGARGCGFAPIIAFGPASSMPHYRPGNRPLQRGVPVLIDIGVVLDGYHSDMTRVVFFGEPDPEMRKIYEVVREAQEKALQACRPGMTAGELDAAARETIRERGFGDYFGHGLGHGIGLDMHELPLLNSKPASKDKILREGMAITIEPGIYLPGKGGVRIEDSVLITKDGCENITQRSKNIIVL